MTSLQELKEYIELVLSERVSYMIFDEIQLGDLVYVYTLEDPTESYVTASPIGQYNHEHIGAVVSKDSSKLRLQLVGDIVKELHILSIDLRQKFKVARPQVQ